MAKQKQLGLQNYLKFGPVKILPMRLLVKALKIQKSAATFRNRVKVFFFLWIIL